MNKILTLAMILLLTTCSNNNDNSFFLLDQETELWNKATTYLIPIDKETWLENQPHSKEKIALGRDLFLDNRLSINGEQSCNTCHNLNTFGVDNKVKSKGHNGQIGARNTPSVYNAVLQFAQFWDGRAATLKEQAILPILNPQEMGMPSENILINRLAEDSDYSQRFEDIYPSDKPSLSLQHIADALAAFESTLVTTSRVDDYLLGQHDALNVLEKEGLNAFIDLGCSPCHSGKGVGGEMMHRFALQGYYWDVTKSESIDEGRYEISKEEEDKYVFKVPSLRNVAETYPYFHDGSVDNLEEAVKTMAKVQLNYNIKEKEVKAIVAFLNALTATE